MHCLFPDWPAPAGIRAAVTFRTGGISQGRYASLNLATHVGDDDTAVAENRTRLRQRLDLPSEPVWLNQVHGQAVIHLDQRGTPAGGRPESFPGVLPSASAGADSSLSPPPIADASFTTLANTVCVVLTADCLPILLTDGQTCAAVHGGWRGLLNGVLDHALARPAWQRLPLAWLGPAIGPEAFEVGREVKDAFLARDKRFASAFHIHGGRLFAHLCHLAEIILRLHGIHSIYGGQLCTYMDPQRFFSHRRDGICGRMATLIWRTG